MTSLKDLPVRVGKNKYDNWTILSESKEEYTFFHLTSFPSCFLILESVIEPDSDILIRCAEMCKQHTKYKHLKDIYVDYTRCGNVLKGEKVGEIEYKSNRKVNKIKV